MLHMYTHRHRERRADRDRDRERDGPGMSSSSMPHSSKSGTKFTLVQLECRSCTVTVIPDIIR